MSNISLAGPIGNSTFDLRPDLENIANAIAADINARGGVACGRKLVLKHHDVNPIDSNDTQTKCLQMVQERPFAVLDYGGYVNPATRRCFINAKIPMEVATTLGQTEVRSGYPYLFSASAMSEQVIRNGVFGLGARGYFKAPAFQKLGILNDACDPSVSRELNAALTKAGVKTSQISRFTLNCAVSAPPNQIQSAVLQHKLDGATHVFMATSVTNNQNYVRIAARQEFRPVYGLSDYGSSLVAPGSGNWDSSFDGTVGITTLHTGEFTSGIKNPQIQACDRILRAHGVPGINSERKDTSALAYCDLFRLFVQAIDHAGTNPTRLGLIQGLSRSGQFRSALLGDAVFDRPGRVTGGDVQRTIQWRVDCTCWKVLQRAFSRGY